MRKKDLATKPHLNQNKSIWAKAFQPYSWEWMLVIVFILLNIYNSSISTVYFNSAGLIDATRTFLDKAFIALSMSFVLMIGYIDISVASTVALSSVAMAMAYNAGVGMVPSLIICLLVGAACGAINGLLLTKFSELAPMIVTLSTQILFRGLAEILLRDNAAGGFPKWFAFFGNGYLGPLPFVTIVFAVFAIIFIIVLQTTTFGRQLYAIGANATASKFSGIKVNRNIFLVYLLNGIMAGVTAIFLTSRMSSTRSNIALAYEMDVIAMVVLGGISTSGGKGRMPGVIIAVFIIGYMRYGLGLTNINPQTLMIIIGIFLIAAVSFPELKVKLSKVIKRS